MKRGMVDEKLQWNISIGRNNFSLNRLHQSREVPLAEISL